jgi:hypothetical protein
MSDPSGRMGMLAKGIGCASSMTRVLDRSGRCQDALSFLSGTTKGGFNAQTQAH